MSTASFEDLVDLLDRTKNPFELSRRMPDIIGGLKNLRDRFQAVEESRVTDMHRMQEMESLTKQEREDLASVAKDRTDLQQRLAALEQRLDAYEARKPDPVMPEYPVKRSEPSKPAEPTFLEKAGLAPSAPPVPTAPA